MAIICTYFIVAVIWAAFGKIDVMALAPGRRIVSERTKVIQPLGNRYCAGYSCPGWAGSARGSVMIELDSTQVGVEHSQNKQQWLAAHSEKLRAHSLQSALSSVAWHR
ncbi:hypothetical protein [Rhodoferax sp.]|uniref:hypothetical protein n=1 Tax=Rhodoferax sp. TaxID=50421 RepID=UPI002ACEA319|nr:hypothetical protein [Rhodoferax sp.]MDZ7921685.1 hypothetical protein [Rhodoferax sp.]